MLVTPLEARPQPEGTTIHSFDVGGFECWFRLPADYPVARGGDAMAVAGLLPAMMRGEPLQLPAALPVDRQLLENLDAVQEIFLAWQEALQLRLHRVEVEAAQVVDARPIHSGALSFFSGGVDGTYTAARQRERIAQAVLLRGIDMQLTNTELWIAAHQGAERLAAHFGLPLLTVETNIRFMGYHHGLKWARHYQGAGLAAIAHLLGHDTALVAATSSLADLAPYGSHPLSDPLWSSGATRILHDGAVPRTEKLRFISQDPVVMEVLRVCWHDSGYNCGKCGKCLRTRVALHLLGVRAPTFPGQIDWKAVGRIRLGDPSEWAFFHALEQLEATRPDPVARRALDAVRRASLRRAALRDLDASLGGPLKRLRSWRKRGAPTASQLPPSAPPRNLPNAPA